MEYRNIGNKIWVRLDPNEEIVTALCEICALEQVTLAEVSGIGAVRKVDAGYFAVKEKKYYSHALNYEYEMTSLMGTITTQAGEVYPHLHINVADQYGVVRGGHLRSAKVSATAEIVLTVLEGTIERCFDAGIGLNLFQFDA